MIRGGGASAAAAFATAHARLRADARFQFDFQAYRPPPPPEWVKWLVRILRPLGPIMPYLFWGAVAAGVGFILFLARRELLRQSARGGAGQAKVLTEGGLAPSRARARALLAEADRLAEAGRFGEAARVLLFRTLDDLEERRPGLIGPAQTAREIARLPALPVAVREPLAGVAAAVERFLFAGRPLARADYDSARADYGRFLAAAAAA